MRRWELEKTYKNCRFFPWKKTTKNQLILTGFFTSFFCTVFSFNSFFFKVHLVDNFNKIWFHLFLFTHPSYMELGSWKQKCWRSWNERRSTQFWSYFAWRLNYFDTTFTWAWSWPPLPPSRCIYRQMLLCNASFGVWKEKWNTGFWYVNSLVSPSSGNDNARVARYLIKTKIL